MDGGLLLPKPRKMTQISPWSVKGVDPQARDAAKTAARKAGKTIGAWLSEVIHSAAAGGPVPGNVPTAGTTAGVATGALPSPTQLPATPGTDALQEEIRKLNKRYTELEDVIAETIEPLVRRVRKLSSQSEATAEIQNQVNSLQRLARDVENVRDLEYQVRELRQRPVPEADTSELREKLNALQRQVEEVAAQSGDGDGVSNVEMQRLENLVEDLRQTLPKQISDQFNQINEIEQELEEIKVQSTSSAGTGPMERAMTRLAERVQKLEEGNAEGKGGLFG